MLFNEFVTSLQIYPSFTGLENILELVAVNGKAIQCAKPTEREINLGLMKTNGTLILPELTNAVKEFLDKSAEDIQTFLYSLQKGSISKVFSHSSS